MERPDIFEAARQGDSARVAALLEDNSDAARRVNAAGELALHVAASNGHRRVAALLLDFGANINACNRRGAAPLALALARGHVAVVSLLLALGAAMDGDAENSFRSPNSPPTGGVFFPCGCPFTHFGARL